MMNLIGDTDSKHSDDDDFDLSENSEKLRGKFEIFEKYNLSARGIFKKITNNFWR